MKTISLLVGSSQTPHSVNGSLKRGPSPLLLSLVFLASFAHAVDVVEGKRKSSLTGLTVLEQCEGGDDDDDDEKEKIMDMVTVKSYRSG